MALLPEAPANAGVGKDPATAYAPSRKASGLSEPPQSPPRTIEVVARRFTFDPAIIEVTAGERVRLLVRSGDGVHGVGIRKFKVNTLVPRGGTPVAIEFIAAEAGTFAILCSEACGDGHAGMRAALVVSATR